LNISASGQILSIVKTITTGWSAVVEPAASMASKEQQQTQIILGRPLDER
jgi:hypothetical protein